MDIYSRGDVERFESELIEAANTFVQPNNTEADEVAFWIKAREAGLPDEWVEEHATEEWTNSEFAEAAMDYLGIYWEDPNHGD